MWRHHPQTLLAQKLIADGAIGDVALIRAALTVGVDVSRTIGGGELPRFGRADAVDQAAAVEAVRSAGATGTTVTLPAPTGTRASS